MSAELIPHMMGVSHRPLGVRGLYCRWRISAGVGAGVDVPLGGLGEWVILAPLWSALPSMISPSRRHGLEGSFDFSADGADEAGGEGCGEPDGGRGEDLWEVAGPVCLQDPAEGA